VQVIVMQVDLSGLRALVTGSTKGIGFAVAQKLAASGAEVAINGRKIADVEAAMTKIRGAVREAKLVAATGDAATAAGVAAIIKAAGEIDILVNNVGIFEIKDAFAIPDDDWQRMFETNVLSGVRFTRHYGPRMRDKGFGRIVFISSESGVQIPTEMIHYGFSKSADLALMRGFAQALAASGVTVNAVLPGPTRTEGVDEMFRSMGQDAADPKAQRDFIDKARPTSIIKRLEQPEEIAEVVAFLVSREAGAISGSPVRADGGVVLGIT
jgi:NAD(P)-dependent dehydrogenase (short-subunit alcohol dehydrogenase family)